ncbi:von Willebrand factor d and egf domain-containing protein-like [Plakobranchus ocellatus]|uniref:von Willebrand factor d and egf domain-containing protein-like n=1 Tax=Plakobranchus ocellatus TaxID=259542 RepID=A0AAV3XT23_9GAST|nr:von Willebrand factor d and egf domain-containing protein-like [Plakobranchus ocellatus]
MAEYKWLRVLRDVSVGGDGVFKIALYLPAPTERSRQDARVMISAEVSCAPTALRTACRHQISLKKKHILTACHISNACYSDGEVDKVDSSRKCAVAQNRTEWTIIQTTQQPHQQLAFFPTLSGPNSDFLMTCRFASKTIFDTITMTWLVNGQKVASEILSTGNTEAFISVEQLPNTGKLTCELETGGASFRSGSVNLAVRS